MFFTPVSVLLAICLFLLESVARVKFSESIDRPRAQRMSQSSVESACANVGRDPSSPTEPFFVNSFTQNDKVYLQLRKP